MNKTVSEIKYHDEKDCSGYCPFHNPSDHIMVDFPLNLRDDLPVPLMERICVHGVGHPDPDSLAYIRDVLGKDGWEIHGCDGCCRENEENKK
ncbi:hypothetical protein LCGC14_2927790 [marine sediment metagenome]|uniref:Uncharacterized protein n=1 Tax=marine sediment metagenome TaxID=412755 RepID=A0A0F8ZUG3_9ZZZZ